MEYESPVIPNGWSGKCYTVDMGLLKRLPDGKEIECNGTIFYKDKGILKWYPKREDA